MSASQSLSPGQDFVDQEVRDENTGSGSGDHHGADGGVGAQPASQLQQVGHDGCVHQVGRRIVDPHGQDGAVQFRPQCLERHERVCRMADRTASFHRSRLVSGR